MMEQPGQNWALPTSEEEQLKKQIAKAYMQDKDVDVAGIYFFLSTAHYDISFNSP
jgi:hypothetical protein